MVLLSPLVHDTPGFVDRCKQPAMQTTIAQAPVQALVMSVLPRTPRINKVGIDRRCAKPGRHPLGHALRAIRTFDIARGPTVDTPPWQHLDDIFSRERSRPVDGQALTGVFLEDREALEPPALCGLVMDDSLAPDMSGIRGTRRRSRAWAPWPPFPPLLNDCKPLVLPEAPHGCAIDRPPCGLAERRPRPVSTARILL
jgi:hypothetical protein